MVSSSYKGIKFPPLTNKEIEEKYFDKGEFDLEKLLKLSKKKPESVANFIKEIGELMNNPDFQKKIQESVRNPECYISVT